MTKHRPKDERPASEIILYQTDDGTTQRSARHEGGLEAEATCKDYLQVRSEGTKQVARRLKHYTQMGVQSNGRP